METQHISALESVQSTTVNHSSHNQCIYKNLIAYGLSLLILCSFWQSAYADWYHIGLDGRVVNTLYETPAGGLFAGTDIGIFKTTGGGANWVESNTGLGAAEVLDIVSDPVTGTHYAATNGSGIFHSTDDGASWLAINSGLSSLIVNELTIDPIYYSRVYAATDDGFYVGNANGWSSLGFSGNPVTNVAVTIDPATNASTIYISLDGSYDLPKLYKAEFFGSYPWVNLDGPCTQNNDYIYECKRINEIAVDPFNPNDIYFHSTGSYDPVFEAQIGVYSVDTDTSYWYDDWYYWGVYGGSVYNIEMLFDPDHPSTFYLGTATLYCPEYSDMYGLDCSDYQDPNQVIGQGGVYKLGPDAHNHNLTGLTNRDIRTLAFGAPGSGNLYTGTNGGGVFEHIDVDRTPDPISFPDIIDAPINTVVTTISQTITGIETDVEISTSGCEYSVNGGADAYSGTVSNNDILRLHITTYSTHYKQTQCSFSLTGGFSTSFLIRTLADDPDQFTFTDQSSSALNAVIISDPITISGLLDSSPISISGGSYSLNNGAFRSTTLYDLVAQDGDTITLRHTSADTFSTTTHTTLTVGGVSDTFSSTTMTADTPLDTVPDAFSFTDITTGFINNTIYSSRLNITGINTLTPISVTGGEYSIQQGVWTSADGFINAGDTVKVRITASNNFSTTVDVVLTIGGISDTFSVTTNADTDGDGIGDTFDSNDDNDGFSDAVDNCTLVANNQLDTDGDGYGNACDSDFNNDGIVNSLDIGLFKTAFFNTGSQQTDINDDNIVNSLDLGLFKQTITSAPGPSGLVP